MSRPPCRTSLADEKQKRVWQPARCIPAARVEAACKAYNRDPPLLKPATDAPIFEHQDFPSLQVILGLLLPETQANLLHKINLQTNYNIPYPLPTNTSASSHQFDASFFMRDRAGLEDLLLLKLPKNQKPLNHEQLLHSKLRWLTLGEQYDWPPSGVVLIYGSKDFMPVHRDVSEKFQRAFASFSVGCDGIFILARGEDGGEGDLAPRTGAIRVRSGDGVHLGGEARWAWRTRARTIPGIPGTCSLHMADWPVGTPGATSQGEKAYKKWKGYMVTKRINVSCRQVWS
ncbi:hypothetical protein BCR34DRAFT_622558 [Clohesyomyces aquaticus]|uniref:Alpha-ketoglutarate-dependent dioxygenase AlkB-like domain-containing protein n=1 Tax=Clohesyomyces aquaticus TaxID=1231657 RepID=A0A1Y2A0F0_9PLEO|nr:hypothetical protein BCR34DRAFT_622558 [Clohesyomyces aquaticus]